MQAPRTPDGRALRHGFRLAPAEWIVTFLAAVMLPPPADALQFTAREGELTGSFDTTLSLGVSIRTEDQDRDIIGRANGGNANSINYDNGNLNYDNGDIWSAPIKVTSELQADYRDVSLFLRGLVYYDIAIMNRDVARRDPISGQQVELSPSAERLAGYRWVGLDAFATIDRDVGNMLMTLKGGHMVINWGESTFIPGGISNVNPIELSRLRVAGAELREAFKANPALDVTLDINERFSLEGFYQFVFRHTEIEPEGTFLSVEDFASPGGNVVFFGFGNPRIPDSPLLFGAGRVQGPPLAPIGAVVKRGADRDARDQGQFGFAFRWFEPKLNDSEFGFYWTHLHSRLPLLSARAGTAAGVVGGDYASTATYFREFPEDLDTLGVSFNTSLASGWALQGEFSYAIDKPVQVDEVELLFAALTPLRLLPDPAAQQTGRLFSQNGIGVFNFQEEIPGFREKDVVQYQMTATQLFGPQLGSDQFTFLAEAGLTYVPDLETDGSIFYNGPGTYTHGNPVFTMAGVQPATQTDGFPDEFSWGYRLLGRLTYNNAVGPVTLEPVLAFAHDVNGTSPGPGGNFVESRKAITATLRANYLQDLQMALSYSAFFGGDEFNQRRDRDFVALSASYSF